MPLFADRAARDGPEAEVPAIRISLLRNRRRHDRREGNVDDAPGDIHAALAVDSDQAANAFVPEIEWLSRVARSATGN